ncbi:MAG: LPS export ABC transporter periplasmic protein LptC [Pseudomonadota bacterium]
MLPEKAHSQRSKRKAERGQAFAQLAAGRTNRRQQGSRIYSYLVGFLKLLLPAAALLIVLVIGLWQNLFGSGTSVGLEQVDGDSVGDRLIAPRYVGKDANERPFVLEADYADQLSGNESVVSFSKPRGEILVDDGFVDLAADAGEFDRTSELLLLEGAVDIRRSDGLTFSTEQLYVDLPAEHAWSDVPVQGSGSFGEIEADGGVDIRDAGRTVRFKGPAKLILAPGASDGLP